MNIFALYVMKIYEIKIINNNMQRKYYIYLT